jgi:hypothetical protein
VSVFRTTQILDDPWQRQTLDGMCGPADVFAPSEVEAQITWTSLGWEGRSLNLAQITQSGGSISSLIDKGIYR